MSTRGIRISDIKDGKCIRLRDLLLQIRHPSEFFWALLWLDGTPKENEGKYLAELQKQVNQSKNGLFLEFESLQIISEKFFQEIEITVIGSKRKENLRRYEEDREMYECCEIVIEMIDGGFWEVFSHNGELINQLEKKFQDTELLTSDYEKIR
jgi:hypothetical protein